jgi:Tfp pilus assembly protein PilN
MTVQVNFLPRAYQLRCRRAGRIRHWLIFCAALIAAQMLSVHFLSYLARQVRQERAHLAAVEKERQALSINQARLVARQRDLSRRLLLVDRLARKHHWSRVLIAMAGRLPQTVMLTGLQTEPPKGQVLVPAPPSGRPNQTPKPGVQQDARKQGVAEGLLITGMATDHESVAELLRALNEENQLGRCQLESTSRQPFMNGEGVTFTIRMRWE